MTAKKKKHASPLLLLLLIPLLCAALALAVFRPKGDPARALDDILRDLRPAYAGDMSGINGEIARASADCFSLQVEGPVAQQLRSASASVRATELDKTLLSNGLAEEMQALLAERAAAAKRSAELYAEDGSVLPTLTRKLYVEAMEARLSHARDYCRQKTVPVQLHYGQNGWELEELPAFLSEFSTELPSMPGFDKAAAALVPVPLHYSLPRTGPGPVPDPACYGETEDPREIAKLLESPTAQRLINGQKLDFDPSRDMLGRPIRYYLDETILALVWQQEEHGAIGTFAEVFIADASQLRRKLADDEFGSYQYYYPHEFAAQTNAVLACSGDFYNSGRDAYGLYVYEGELMRCNVSAGQSCLFTDKGDMLFVYENQFATEDEARRFVKENSVVFSLSFGPVLIDNGKDVTPEDYLFGEVREGYARCAVGQLGERHYLMMTLNREWPDHDVLVVLRKAADSMLAHGCVNAYTLDGGQTGSILLGGELINPVQFGTEREMSDIFYFATALAED